MVQETAAPITTSKGIEVDYPFIKVPFEQARRVFRHSQRILEQKLAPLAKTCSSNPTEAANTITDIIKTLEEDRVEGNLFRDRCQKRLKFAHQLSHSMDIDESSCVWDKVKTDRLVNEYLLCKGLFESGDLLATNSKLKEQEFCDSELYAQLFSILGKLKDHSTSECLLWCFENRAHLKKNNSSLEFLLRRQTFVELARKRDLFQAITYAKKFFPGWLDSHKREIEQCMALLAISGETESEPYKSLYHEDRWKDLTVMFEKEYLDLHCVSQKPRLISNIQAGLSALKTPMCGVEGDLNINCPVCVPPYTDLSAGLPFSHHENSSIVCRVTGEVMNENNAPMVLPNGRVYSEKALRTMAANCHGMVTCPRTGQSFEITEAKKVYIL